MFRKNPEVSAEQAELFQLVARNVKEYAIFVTDKEGTVVSWNPGVERLLGYTEAQIVGQSIAIIFTDEDRAGGAHEKEMMTAAQTGCAEDKRWHQRRDGTRFWANGMVIPLKKDDGTLRGFTKIMRDDTAQKKSEEKLEQANRYIENILSSIADSFYTLDDELRYVYVNRATTEMFGLSEADFLGKTLQEVFPEVEGSIFHAEVRQALEERTSKVFENYYAPLDRWFENRIYPLANGLSIITSEITARKRAEAKLFESEQRLGGALSLARLGTFEWIVETSEVLFDERSREIFGFPEGISIKAEDVFARIHPADLASVRQGAMAAIESGTRFEINYRIVLPDGTIRVVQSLNNPVVGSRRVTERMVGVFSDLTVSRRAEENLRESEDKYRSLFNSIASGFCIIEMIYDAAGEAVDWRFLEANPAFERNNSIRDVEGKRITELAPAIEPKWFEIYGRVAQTGEPERVIEGSEALGIWFDVYAFRVGEPEERRLAVLFNDITAQKAAEAERERMLAVEQGLRTEAENANRLKDEFLATLSHELRTPLSSILGWSKILLSSNVGAEQTQKALETINRNAESQKQLIEDILDVSRIISGKLRLDVRAVDLMEVITTAVETARPGMEAKDIRLQTLLDPKAGIISGDPDRLQQVVWNLLSNALKFTQRHGRVQVRLERVNSCVELSVSDTGKGIELEFLPYVFDRFRQSDGSMTRRQGGLGLGLAIVRQIVELHGGTVDVMSEGAGYGAAFTVSLPVIPIRQEPESETPRVHTSAVNNQELNKSDETELAGLQLLIIDDESDSRVLVKMMLELSGAEVTEAKSAAEALKIINSRRFDAIISDIGMPDEDGFSLIEKVRGLPGEQGGATPAVALTAYARAEDRIRAMRSGFQMHIAKPVEHAELIAVILNLVGKAGR